MSERNTACVCARARYELGHDCQMPPDGHAEALAERDAAIAERDALKAAYHVGTARKIFLHDGHKKCGVCEDAEAYMDGLSHENQALREALDAVREVTFPLPVNKYTGWDDRQRIDGLRAILGGALDGAGKEKGE